MSNTREWSYGKEPIVLVYQDCKGYLHEQNIFDIVECGPLIDPENGDDMDIVGWAKL